ncbi:MAG: hypothetical protein FJ119_11665 [Deltaproteobacteria bacterium]|nr:hypothetical protein [Deltaproteobacteria bacterium]
MRVSMRNIVMGCMAVGFGMLLAASDVTAQEASIQTPSKAALQRLYTNYLTEEGYKPEVDDDGDVRFKREGRLYFIAVSDKDPEFFRVVLANIWPIESEKERVQVLVAADESNAKSKVSKVFTVRDNVWVNIELFLARPEDFKGVFKRAMSALDTGVENFAKKMRE